MFEIPTPLEYVQNLLEVPIHIDSKDCPVHRKLSAKFEITKNCKCKKAIVVISEPSDIVCCGVKGIEHIVDAYIKDSVVTCIHCHDNFHKDE
jgi:hypothetical protein